MTEVLQIFRRKNPAFFSIEKVFALIQPSLNTRIQVKSVALPSYTSGLLSIFRNLNFLRKQHFGGLFHITGDVHYAALALPASSTVLTIHDCVFLHTSKGFKRRILKWLFLDMPVKRVAVVTTISEFSKQEIVRFTGCKQEKIHVIPNPVNANIFFYEKPFNSFKPIVLFVGTTPNKNLERVTAALEGISCHLRILGKPNALHISLLNKHNIEFSAVDNISETALSDLYAAADIVLFPSTFEGFGLPILEAQQAGRIVITSNTEPMKTVAGGGALLVDPYNVNDIRQAFKQIITDAGLRDELIQIGFKNTTKYSVEQIAVAYSDVYKRVAGNNH